MCGGIACAMWVVCTHSLFCRPLVGGHDWASLCTNQHMNSYSDSVDGAWVSAIVTAAVLPLFFRAWITGGMAATYRAGMCINFL